MGSVFQVFVLQEMLRVVLALVLFQLTTAQKCSRSEFRANGKCVCVIANYGIRGHSIRYKNLDMRKQLSDVPYNICMAICKKRPDCHYITYNIRRRNCGLRKASGRKGLERHAGFIVAHKSPQPLRQKKPPLKR